MTSRMHYFILVSTLILMNSIHSVCLNIDSLYQKARSEAFSGDRKKAEEICKIILRENKSIHDARLLYGQLLAWRKEYDESMKQLEIIISKANDYIDAFTVLIDVAFWAGDNDYALSICKRGLIFNPDNFELHYRKARSMYHLGKLTEAYDLAGALLKEKPDHGGLIQLHENIISGDKIKKMHCEYKLTDKLKSRDDKHHDLTFKYSHPSKPGNIEFKIKTASKFNKLGIQFESDFYPKIGNKGYLFVSLGYSPSEIYPDFRSAVDIYYSSKFHFHISCGVCYMYFDKSVWIYNSSIGSRIRQFYSEVKGILTPDLDLGKHSLTLTTRFKYYFNKKSDFDFCELRSEIEKFPNELDKKYSGENIRLDKNIRGALEIQKKIGRFLLLGVGGEYLLHYNVYSDTENGYLTFLFKTTVLMF